MNKLNKLLYVSSALLLVLTIAFLLSPYGPFNRTVTTDPTDLSPADPYKNLRVIILALLVAIVFIGLIIWLNSGSSIARPGGSPSIVPGSEEPDESRVFSFIISFLKMIITVIMASIIFFFKMIITVIIIVIIFILLIVFVGIVMGYSAKNDKTRQRFWANASLLMKYLLRSVFIVIYPFVSNVSKCMKANN